MTRAFESDAAHGLRPAPSRRSDGPPPIWLDLANPDAETLAAVGAELGVCLPSREDMEAIEASSRIYVEDGVAFLTVVAPYDMDGEAPGVAPLTFVLAPDRLVTLRHHDHRAIVGFPSVARHAPIGCVTAIGVMLGLFDALTDRLADVLERAAREIDDLSQAVFRPAETPQGKSRDFQRLLVAIGRQGDLLSKLRDSLNSLDRVFGFLGAFTLPKGDKEARAAVKTLARDAHSLVDYTEFLSAKITLLLDAIMGMISIEQNAIIKFFSVVAVVFLPPTLIASVYGMNFQDMPELGWSLGYPLAVLLMVVSAILPYLFFRRRGWL